MPRPCGGPGGGLGGDRQAALETGRRIKLQAANPTYPDILPKDGQEVEVWGVVTNAIKAMTV